MSKFHQTAPLPLGSSAMSMSTTNSIAPTTSDVLWYYLENNTWKQFDITTCCIIENLFLSGNYVVDYPPNRFDFRKMMKITSTRQHCPIRRENTKIDSNSTYWEWQDDSFWVPYSDIDSDTISIVNKCQNSVTLYVGNHAVPYEIDTAKLRQTNMSTKFRRKIRPTSYFINSSSNASSTTTSTNVTSATTTNATLTSTSVAPSPKTSHIDPKKVLHIQTVISQAQIINEPEEDLCPICMDEYSTTDPALGLNKCTNHCFHSKCIETALLLNGKCPICSYIYMLPGNILIMLYISLYLSYICICAYI
jgi:hypothetical protein